MHYNQNDFVACSDPRCTGRDVVQKKKKKKKKLRQFFLKTNLMASSFDTIDPNMAKLLHYAPTFNPIRDAKKAAFTVNPIQAAKKAAKKSTKKAAKKA